MERQDSTLTNDKRLKKRIVCPTCGPGGPENKKMTKRSEWKRQPTLEKIISLLLKKAKARCKEHLFERTYICTQCNVSICPECKCESHLGHKTSRVQDEYLYATKRVKKELESLNQAIKQDQDQISLFDERLNRLQNVDEAVKPVTDSIQQLERKAIEKVRNKRRRREAKAELRIGVRSKVEAMMDPSAKQQLEFIEMR